MLTPSDPLLGPNTERLCAELTAFGLLGEALPGDVASFVAGPQFLALVTFAGCAVQLETTYRGAGAPPVHIRIDGPSAAPRLCYGPNTRPPRCPACRTLLRDWRSRVGIGDSNLACAACGTSHRASGWDWREHGGAGRLFVCIEGVFPGEAVPTPTLTQRLRSLTQSEWRHFSIQAH